MKKLLLALITLIGAGSLHGMESSFAKIVSQGSPASVDRTADKAKTDKQLSPITLPQIYRHFSEVLNQDVARYIFSLQPGSRAIGNNIHLLNDIANTENKMSALIYNISMILNNFGYCYTVERLNRNLLRQEKSIYDIKDSDGRTILHNGFTNVDSIKVLNFFLQIAGDNTWKLLTMQNNKGCTTLHYTYTAWHIESVKLLLNAAGENAQELMDIPNKNGKTAFDIADPEIKELMLQYQKKDSVISEEIS